jgi:ectoine hydroxylase-related dioxygenase (phytanoyl-CoA dioxygenase family)
MNTVIKPDPVQRQIYLDNGFVFCQQILSSDEASELLDLLRPALEGDLGHVGFGEEGNTDIKHGRQQQIGISNDGPIPELADHPYRQRGQELAEYLAGYPLQFSYGQVIAKPGEYSAKVQWHQDGHYWQGRKASEAGISCWIALTECHPGNGSVGYVTGSHLTGINQHDNAVGKYEFHQAYEVPEPEPEKVEYAHLSPGDAAFHHSMCIHGSSGNQTSQPRIGIVSHFFPVD